MAFTPNDAFFLMY